MRTRSDPLPSCPSPDLADDFKDVLITTRARSGQPPETPRQSLLGGGATEQDARRRLAFLTEVSTLLGRSLDVDETLQQLADLAVPWLADW